MLVLWFLILVSGKNIEYSQAVGKSYSEKVAILKKIAIRWFLRLAQSSYFLNSLKELIFIEYILDYFKIKYFFVCSIWHESFMFCFQQDICCKPNIKGNFNKAVFHSGIFLLDYYRSKIFLSGKRPLVRASLFWVSFPDFLSPLQRS